ncbi:hypothetical protein C9975_11475, partial [Thalassospira xiamenensis]
MGFVQRHIHKGLGPKLIMVPAAIGVPVHELSHYLMAKLMGHKVTQVKLFMPMKDGTLGFVEHAYRRSWWSPFANLMIGMAPLIGGLAAFSALTHLFVPDVWIVLTERLQSVATVADALRASKDMLDYMSKLDWNMVSGAWAFMSLSILGFMLPSRADFDGAMAGIIFASVGAVAAIYL